MRGLAPHVSTHSSQSSRRKVWAAVLRAFESRTGLRWARPTNLSGHCSVASAGVYVARVLWPSPPPLPPQKHGQSLSLWLAVLIATHETLLHMGLAANEALPSAGSQLSLKRI